jgi:TetR/AcrR family transcriptional regulator, transcriptional repressor for nem operon
MADTNNPGQANKAGQDVSRGMINGETDPPAENRRHLPAIADHSGVALTPRGRAAHARIVGAAADLIYQHGLGNTTLREVREAANASGSQMTHYFSDKHALVRSVIAWRRDEMVGFHTTGSLARLDSLQALQDWADLNVQKQIDGDCVGGCRLGSLVGELPRADGDFRADVTAVYDEWIALFHTALTTMRKRGALRPDADPRHLARVLIAAHQGGSLLTQTTRTINPLRDALNAAVRYVCSFAPESATHPPRRPVPRRRAR